VEGPTDDTEITVLRRRQQRNLLATLLLSQGVPMVLMGDEVGRTQGGNNNAYCQDNEISWFDWDDGAYDAELFELVARLTRFRRDHPVFHRRRWFTGRSIRGDEVHEIGWLRSDGEAMTDEDWDAGFARTLGLVLNGDAIPSAGPRGEKVVDDTFLVAFNAHHEDHRWTAPGAPWGTAWAPVLDTARPELGATGPEGETEPEVKAGDTFTVTARSLQVLRSTTDDDRRRSAT
jgi:glycogen operon protein